jgi:hypothetical protein
MGKTIIKPAPRDATAERLTALLADYGRTYPDVWRTIDQIRAQRAALHLDPWPQYCFLPAATALALEQAARGGGELPPLEASLAQGRIMLAAWRTTQGIYRFDPAVMEAVAGTPLSGDIPAEVLRALPEWCVYVDLGPGRTLSTGEALRGYFAHLDVVGSEDHLDLSLDFGGETPLITLPLSLARGNLPATLEDMRRDNRAWADERGYEHASVAEAYGVEDLAPLINLLLYLCSQNADLSRSGERPLRPRFTRTKKGDRMFPPDQPRVWECGFRLGAAIRAAQDRQASKAQGGTHASPRPHIRRAHWHSFWTGAKAKPGQAPADRKLVLQWLPPIPVNVDEAAPVIPTIRAVR